MNEESQKDKLCSEAVFRSVFDTNFKVLRNFLVYQFRGDIENAEDVAQSAFVKLWENCSLLKPEQAKSFLYTTAIRLSLNKIKHSKVVNHFELQFQPKTAHQESPDFLMEEIELKTQLEKAINELPEKQRTVFLMNRFDNQSYTEIAAALDLSVKAVEKRMHLALLSLRKVVKNV
ncbi:RNA polymerase sigma factor [Flavobacterium sedimenticola]|uniref:Sigma-70 family RNA polymerase sigma factor n=1 Tax=Flavobacterium sedimenticola TaxID=3043286 RepID=A0ABT6XS16_9FLAO|nr:sigma-70 family RNA polymerase sigma factor [Flavobacterium sedimenticola]MDI9257642.1 sigma-70 family RNA polymerase sigma factor [Flavobacterium sedimenticola]